ncbi:aquaporin [bacterium]|nr:aquaporin [bacterium]
MEERTARRSTERGGGYRMLQALKRHWPEYLMEAGELGLFMISAGLFAGLLLAAYVALESPLSGTGLNPARTFASALPSGIWTAGWIYFIAPPLGMLLAGEAFRWSRHRGKSVCAKLNHYTTRRCIFRCGYMESGGSLPGARRAYRGSDGPAGE